MSASNINHTEFLDHFRLNIDPFSSEKENLRFFRSFNLNTKQPLTAEQTIVYIQFVLSEAGPGTRITIEEEAYQELYRISMGSVYQIKTIMDQALHKAFADRTLVINKEYIDAPQRRKGTKTLNFKAVIPIMLAAVVLFGLIGTALVFWKGKGGVLQENTPEPTTIITKKKHIPNPEPSRTAVPTPRKKIVKNQDQDTDEPVMKFLTAYNLQKYEPLFFKAIVSENFNDITNKIHNETGLMLIHFTSVPETVKNRYRILEKVLLNPVHKRFFLFWKPSQMISKYENGVKGKQIKQLQTMLQKIDLYDHDIDGVVDIELTRALIRFQRQNFLEQTGSPDTSTLFLLIALSE